MPIIASFALAETRRKTGAAAGKLLPTLTVSTVPFTESVAEVTFCAELVEPVEEERKVLEPRPADVPAPPPERLLLPELDDELAAPDGAAPPALALAHKPVLQICCWNGSLLLNRLKETSWPDEGGSGMLGSWTPSLEVARDEPLGLDELEPAAAEPPASVGGASGFEPGVVTAPAEVVDALVVTVPEPCSILSVRGA
jgi:hypothetical protein